jgi:hypothetical protein
VSHTIKRGTAVAVLAGCMFGFLVDPAVASPTASSQASAGDAIPSHSRSVRLAGTVNVASLARSVASTHSNVRIPLRPGQQLFSPQPSTPLEGTTTGAASSLTITPGTPLVGTLGDGDNIALTGGQLTPPDMGFAANGSQEIELVNAVGKIWNGTTPGPGFSLASFFSPISPGDFLGDPWVKWDAGSGRFFAGIGDFTWEGELMAVSQTSDPSGSWFLYRVQYPSTADGIIAGGCPDQGKGAVDNNVVALGFNEYWESGVAGCTAPNSADAAIEVFNKSQMMAGATLNMAFTDPLTNRFSMVPADTLTTSATTEYFASLDYGTGTTLHRLTSVGVPGVSTVTFTSLADITVPGYSIPPSSPQKGTTTLIDSGDDRTQNVAVLGNNMTVTATVGCVPKNDTATRSCGQVYEVNNGTNTLKKSVTIAHANTYFFYPAATFIGTGTVAVSIGRSTSTTFGSLYTTAGTWGANMAGPLHLKAGNVANITGRYGDYFAATPQPGTTNQFWVAGEVGGKSGQSNAQWSTAAGLVTAS